MTDPVWRPVDKDYFRPPGPRIDVTPFPLPYPGEEDLPDTPNRRLQRQEDAAKFKEFASAIHLHTATELFGEDLAKRLLAAENGDGRLKVSRAEFQRMQDAVQGHGGPPKLFLFSRLRAFLIGGILALLLCAGCGGEDMVDIVGRVPVGDPGQPCTIDSTCNGLCHVGQCIDKACTHPEPLKDGTLCGEGAVCSSGQCTLPGHGPECGEGEAYTFSVGDGDIVVICDRCSSSCEPMSLIPCAVKGECCEYDGRDCITHCVACCDGASGGLWCEFSPTAPM